MNLKETEDGVYGKNKVQKKKGEQYKTFILLSQNTKEKVIISYIINYLSKIPIIHISQYIQNFPCRLTILFPRVKDHLTKVSTPGIGSRFFFFL